MTNTRTVLDTKRWFIAIFETIKLLSDSPCIFAYFNAYCYKMGAIIFLSEEM
jgi:hypothetical protein